MQLRLFAGLALIIAISAGLAGCPRPQPPAVRPQGQPSSADTTTAVQSPTEEVIPPAGQPIHVGTKFPMFTARTTGGDLLALDQLLGEKTYVLVWFWALWNDPQANEMVDLVPTFTSKEGERFHLVTVNLDEPSHRDAVNNMIQTRAYRFPVVPDYNHTDKTLADAYGMGIGKKPGNFLLGPDGTVLLRDISPQDLDGILATLLSVDQIYQPIVISIAFSQEIQPQTPGAPAPASQTGRPARNAPEALLLSANIVNPQASQEGYQARVIYRALAPTGDVTNLRTYPDDPASGLISADGIPITFTVVSGEYAEIPSQVAGGNAEFMLDIILKPETYVVEYWGEAWSTMLNRMVPGEKGKEDFAQIPYCTPEAVERQGGIISPLETPTQ